AEPAVVGAAGRGRRKALPAGRQHLGECESRRLLGLYAVASIRYHSAILRWIGRAPDGTWLSMFTGLVEAVGRVKRLDPIGSGGRALVVAAELFAREPPKLGDSIAIDGVCLTVTALASEEASFVVGPETLERSTLGSLKAGSTVNLERPLRLGDRLGGHL